MLLSSVRVVYYKYFSLKSNLQTTPQKNNKPPTTRKQIRRPRRLTRSPGPQLPGPPLPQRLQPLQPVRLQPIGVRPERVRPQPTDSSLRLLVRPQPVRRGWVEHRGLAVPGTGAEPLRREPDEQRADVVPHVERGRQRERRGRGGGERWRAWRPAGGCGAVYCGGWVGRWMGEKGREMEMETETDKNKYLTVGN